MQELTPCITTSMDPGLSCGLAAGYKSLYAVTIVLDIHPGASPNTYHIMRSCRMHMINSV